MVYFDSIKETIKKMIKDTLGNDITITDVLNKKQEFNNYKVLFNSYVDNDKSKIKIISYEEYDVYGKEVPPVFASSIVGLFIYNDNISYKISDYDNGILTLENEIDGMKKNINELIISSSEPSGNDDTDMILISSIYNFNKTLSKILVENYRRFDIVYYVYNDENENKANYFMNKIGNIFNRDFFLINEKNETTKELCYIQSQLRFELSEYNISSRIIRGTMLVKTYNK